MAEYAKTTTVPVDRTRAEIERTLTRYGADSFGYAFNKRQAIIVFEAQGRKVRFELPIPDPEDPAFTRKKVGYGARTKAEAEKLWNQALRQSWRALLLVIKAKLEAVDAGIMTFEDEFAMYMVLPDNRRVRDVVQPAVDRAYETGAVPPLLGLPAGE